MSESRGVALVNLGCRVNRVELDHMALDLERAGAVLTPEREARVVIVNTCAVTGEAEAKTRKAVRRAASLPSSKGKTMCTSPAIPRAGTPST